MTCPLMLIWFESGYTIVIFVYEQCFGLNWTLFSWSEFQEVNKILITILCYQWLQV